MARFTLAALTASVVLGATNATCPPANFQSKQTLNPAKFFEGRWHALAQLPVKFQEEDLFYCITANYRVQKTALCRLIGCDDKVVKVYNTANRDSVNGAQVSVTLNGLIPDADVPSKAIVGPPFLPSNFYGPYWVIESGSYSDLEAGNTTFEGENYEWALISGGEPEVATAKGCVTGKGPENQNGIWLLSRQPIVSQETYEKALALVASKGFDVNALKKVTHEGCKY
jgi:lipocalin